MNSLERYKMLSDEDKSNLIVYCVYDSIYFNAKEKNYEISDEEVNRIKDLSYSVYLKDEYYDLSPSHISDYITRGYLEYKIPLEKFENMNRYSILEAVDDNKYIFEEEIER